jgi:hypothetical protein
MAGVDYGECVQRLTARHEAYVPGRNRCRHYYRRYVRMCVVLSCLPQQIYTCCCSCPLCLVQCCRGYNTAAERAAAKATPGIRVLSKPAFIELLKWGILMGVDDGCEPTADEVAAGVHVSKR